MRIKSIKKVLAENLMHRAEMLSQSLQKRAGEMGATNNGLGSKSNGTSGDPAQGAEKYKNVQYRKRKMELWFSLSQNITKNQASEFKILGDHYYAKVGKEHIFTDVHQSWLIVFTVKENAIDLMPPTTYTIKDIQVYIDTQATHPGGLKPRDKDKLEKAKFVLVSNLQRR
jgi:hypothetical protein